MLPKLSHIPFDVLKGATLGFIYGYCIAKTKVSVWAFAISALVNTILFAIANPLFHGDASVRSFKIYRVTDLLVAMASIIAFRQLKLIATLGTLVLSIFHLYQFGRRTIILYRFRTGSMD